MSETINQNNTQENEQKTKWDTLTEDTPLAVTMPAVLNSEGKWIEPKPSDIDRFNTSEIDLGKQNGELEFLVATLENARRDTTANLRKNTLPTNLYGHAYPKDYNLGRQLKAELTQIDNQDTYLHGLYQNMENSANGNMSISEALKQDRASLNQKIEDLEAQSKATLMGRNDPMENPIYAKQIKELSDKVFMSQHLSKMLRKEQAKRMPS